MTEIKKGSCLCSKISFKISGPTSEVTACHCTQCRKQSGHYYAALNANEDQFQIDDDEGLIRWYRASDFAMRGFCSNCGSALFWKRDGSNLMSVLAGSIDGATNLKISEHIFTDHKGDYYAIDENIPQFGADKT